MSVDTLLGSESTATLTKLAVADVPRAVEVLCDAFESDPFVNWVVRSDAKRRDGMRRFFDVCVRQLTLPLGEVRATEDLSGVGLWTPPGGFKLGLSEQLHFAVQAVRAMQLTHLPARRAVFDEVERHHPQSPHYYLFFLAVDPNRQGEGIGSRMMRYMLRRCDAEGMPAYLEATHQGLIPFYAHLGYRLLEPIALEHGCPSLYPMWRDPATKGGGSGDDVDS